jgi:hypothetical protein
LSGITLNGKQISFDDEIEAEERSEIKATTDEDVFGLRKSLKTRHKRIKCREYAEPHSPVKIYTKGEINMQNLADDILKAKSVPDIAIAILRTGQVYTTKSMLVEAVQHRYVAENAFSSLFSTWKKNNPPIMSLIDVRTLMGVGTYTYRLNPLATALSHKALKALAKKTGSYSKILENVIKAERIPEIDKAGIISILKSHFEIDQKEPDDALVSSIDTELEPKIGNRLDGTESLMNMLLELFSNKKINIELKCSISFDERG